LQTRLRHCVESRWWRAARDVRRPPALRRESAARSEIRFTPIPLIDKQYTNRPTGIDQVMQFGP
jgi:hypothetical protein